MYHQTSTPQSKAIWNSKFENIKWKSVWTFSQKFFVTNKIKEVAFKILHLIYPTNHVVVRFGVVERGCVFCNHETETICHLFFECVYCQIFWSKVEQFYNVQTGSNIQLREKDVLFFYGNTASEHRKSYILNLLILYGKYCIHKCKWSQKPPKIQQFIKEVEFDMTSLHTL